MEAGLTQEQAVNRLNVEGANDLLSHNDRGLIWTYLKTFQNPLVLVLLAVGSISIVIGNQVDGLLVYAMVLMSTVIDFIQEYHSNKAAQELQKRIAPQTKVFRDGQETLIDSRLLVREDKVKFEPGSMVTADCRIIKSHMLYVNQATITGESFPVPKLQGEILLAGSSIVSGDALAIITGTGVRTELGRLAETIATTEKTNSFTLGVTQFSKSIVKIIITFVVIIFILNSMVNGSIVESFMFAIAVAVGLTPEFLPMVMSITMSRGSIKMAKHGVIVKKLTAIPTIGSMKILCTDKTGTLTQDHITLIRYENSHGDTDDNVLKNGMIASSYQSGGANPIDSAIIEYGSSFGPLPLKIDEIPFDFDRRRMSVIVAEKKMHTLITKGSPESIISIASHFQEGLRRYKLTGTIVKKINSRYHELSADGYRVILVAQKSVLKTRKHYDVNDEKGVTILGLLAFMDPIKPGIRLALDKLEEIGVELKVITGDNEAVTKKICKDADIPVNTILTGLEIDSMSDDELHKSARRCSIFARCSPTQKERIITILRRGETVVGYMGDGINDAPSLKAADVGISVSNAVDVAKEAADIVLTKNDLLQLSEGVIEGRKTFGNTMKYILMGLSSNFGNMFSVLGAVLFLPFLPMLPIQILLNNFLYDLSQITLPLDDVDVSYITSPKHWDMSGIVKFMGIIGPISSVFDFLVFLFLFRIFKETPYLFQTGWFMESLASQALVIHVIRTRKLPFIKSSAHPLLWLSTVSVTLLGWLIPYSPLGKYFGLAPLPTNVVGVLVVIVVTYLIVAELGKQIFYRNIETVA